MKLDVALALGKMVASGGAAVGMLAWGVVSSVFGAVPSWTEVQIIGLTPWGWAAAFAGGACLYHFEPERTPATAAGTVFGIFASGFVGGLAAVIAPHVPWGGIGEFAGNIPIEARAGACGITICFIWEQLRRRQRKAEREDS